MKTYPSIPNSGGTNHRDIPGAYIFDKIDGNNLRFEWNRKQGWYKFGSRNGLIDESNEQFVGAIPWFLENLADHIHSSFKKHPTHIVAFAEWAGPNSFAGMHELGDKMALHLFDVAVDKRGIMDPRDFIKTFEHVPHTVNFLGIHNWTRGYVQDVYDEKIEGVTFEGVVGKDFRGNQLIMAKAKTKSWKDKVKQIFHGVEAEKLLAS